MFLIRRNGLATEIKETTEGFIATEARLETRHLFGSGVIESSLYAALDSGGISDELGSEMADILSSEIDFNRDLRSGDRFSVIYTAKYLRGTYVSYGQIQALEFINKAQKYRAYVFIDPKSGQPSYYDVEGENIKNAFLKSPLKFSRVTSGFSKRRLHPVLKKWRAHKGIDYGARPGTPIMATGKGKITYRGTKGAYGRFIEIRHANGISTRYAHMSKYAKGLKKGSRVDQGQVIGFVGSSGMATGPHLHYEFLVRGKQINPSKAVPAPGPPINAQLRKNFDEQTARSAELLEKLYKSNVK
jgi:murein DD-endopeptidase MepM/ murein hydrolase activator NlpD